MLPWLQSQIRNSWLDPKAFKTREEFDRAYDLAFSFAQVAQSVIDKVDRDVDEADQLTKKEEGKLLPKTIN